LAALDFVQQFKIRRLSDAANAPDDNRQMLQKA
jgi:hypothetical protein